MCVCVRQLPAKARLHAAIRQNVRPFLRDTGRWRHCCTLQCSGLVLSYVEHSKKTFPYHYLYLVLNLNTKVQMCHLFECNGQFQPSFFTFPCTLLSIFLTMSVTIFPVKSEILQTLSRLPRRSSQDSSCQTKKLARTLRWTCTGCQPTPSARSSAHAW